MRYSCSLFTCRSIRSMIFQMIIVFNVLGGAERNPPPSLQKTDLQEWKTFDINTILCSINSSGQYCDYLRTNNSGLTWPKGTAKTAVYTAGLWVIGVHRPTGLLRTAVQNYQSEYQPGPILTTFNTSTNNAMAAGDPAGARYRIYKTVRKDSIPGSNKDYDEWPADLGAPFIDLNSNGTWDPGIDKPKLWGDQQLWSVYNDADESRHARVGTTKPLGIEIQATYFGFNQPGALGNTMFIRWKMINKSDADYDNVCVSMWSDIDMGAPNDDLCAVDTLRKLGYIYNGDNNDEGAAGYGSRPPACGFIFFQGPKVPSAADTALFEGRKIPGWKNLSVSSHAAYFNGSGMFYDPPLGSVNYPERSYAYMNGINGTTYLPFTDPTTGNISKFLFPGDPVTETGWTMTKSKLNPTDVRSLLSAGPFTLAKGDTQEIVGGFVIAQGTDRLNSITVLRRYTDIAQEAFDRNFVLPAPPPAPPVIVCELPKRAVLSWGDPASYKHAESFSYKGAGKDYRFEGYNIYQSESRKGPWKRVVTFDAVDDVKMQLDYVIDAATGIAVQIPVAFGTDSGIKRNFTVEKDYLNGTSLVNGKEYYFAVTVYANNFNPDGASAGLPVILESGKEAIVVVPRQAAVGDVIASNPNDLLITDRTKYGDDAVTAQVIDPRSVTGGTYEISFDSTAASYMITRRGVGPDAVAAANITDLTGSDASPIIDGLMFRVTSPLPGVRRDTQNPKGYNYLPAENLWFSAQTSGAVMQAMANGLAYPTGSGVYDGGGTKVTPDKLSKVQIRFSSTAGQKSYRYLRNVKTLPMQLPKHWSFAPYIIHRGAGAPWQDFVDVPFTVWERDTLAGVPVDRQLNCAFLEDNDSLYNYDSTTFLGLGRVDGKWMPTTADNGGREVLYIFRSTYSPAIDSNYTNRKDASGRFIVTGANQYMDIQGLQDSMDIMYILWVKANSAASAFVEGDRFNIAPNYVLTPASKFTIQAPKNDIGNRALMKDAIARINVFPNPYFANNKAEVSVYQRFVTFTNLPAEALIRIFNLTGELVKTIRHNNTTGFERWDLRNESLLPVASGMYLAHIEIKDAGSTILKIAVIQPQERSGRF